ncbi:MAG: ECF transporter S component [Candidatus Promineifilaceae bacterium]|jgi:energy-coupling factor transport system substrate-specific component
MDQLRKDFSTVTIALIVVALAINIVVGTIIFQLKIPFVYLDSIGTILVGLLAGPWAGLVTGILSNLLWGLLGNPGYVPYAPVAGVIGLMAGIFGSMGWFKSWWKWLLAGLITGLVAALLSAPITAYVYGGVTGAGTDLIVGMFRATGSSIMEAALGQGLITDLIDKTFSFFVVWLIVKALPTTLLTRFSRSQNVLEMGDVDLENILDQ